MADLLSLVQDATGSAGIGNASDNGSNPTDDYPNYLRAADAHNIGNYGSSWFDGDAWASGLKQVPKFAAVSVLSGVNSFYNTAVSVGNFFGGNFEKNDTDDWITSLDSDLGQYYGEHQQAADLAGFLATSIIPGVAGIKVFNAGQKALTAARGGLLGENLAGSLGLLVPKTDAYIKAASLEIASGQATFNALSTNTLKALGSGIRQQALEGAAFEIAVQATMQSSPILEGQDVKDILWNTATSVTLGGAIGGAFEAAKTFGAVKKGVIGIAQDIRTQSTRDLIAANTSPSDRLVLNAFDSEKGVMLDPGDPLYREKAQALELRQTRIAQDQRSDVNTMTKGNATLGNMVADSNVGNTADEMMGKWLHADQVTAMSGRTDVEAEIADLLKAGKPVPPELQVNYVKLTGNDAGQVLDSAPVNRQISDVVTPAAGKSYRDSVIAYARNAGNKIDQLWDASKQSLISEDGIRAAESRQIWASEILKEIPDGTAIHMNDFPLLERAFNDGQGDIRIVDGKGNTLMDRASRTDLQSFMMSQKNNVAADMLGSALNAARRKTSQFGTDLAQQGLTDRIARITNMSLDNLEGQASKDFGDYLGWQGRTNEYAEYLKTKGLKPLADQEVDPRFLPSIAKISRRMTTMTDLDGNVTDGLTYLRTTQKLAEDAADRVVAAQFGSKYFDQLQKLNTEDLSNTTPYGAGAGLFKFANAGYGDPAAKMQLNGSVVNRAKQSVKEDFSARTNGTFANLARNQEATIEWSKLNQDVVRSTESMVQQVLNDGTTGLISKRVATAAEDAGVDLTNVSKDELDEYAIKLGLDDDKYFLPVTQKETWDAVQAHMTETAGYEQRAGERAAARGKEFTRQADIFRAITPDPRDYKFFAHVIDDTITGQGHKTMLFAQSESELKALADRAMASNTNLSVLYKQDTTDFFNSYAMYDYDRTLHENFVDSALKSKGVYSNYFLQTDPQKVTDSLLQYHLRRIETDVTDTARLYNESSFNWLEDQAKSYSRVETSVFGGNFDKLAAQGKNPYLSYIKTGLDISRAQENPLWYSANKMLDDAVSKVVGMTGDLFDSMKGKYDPAKVQEINDLLDKYGINTGWRTAADEALINHTAPKGELSKFVRGANAVMSKLTLGLDPLNGLNNFIGANVLRMTELTQLTRAISEGDTELAGKLGMIDVTGAGDRILSPTKLMGQAYKEMMNDDGTLIQKYRDLGVVKDATAQFKQIVDDGSLKGTETVGDLNSRLQRMTAMASEITQKGERLSGNKFFEDSNRFLSANVADQLTRPAIEQGILTQKEADAYINIFVNRVDGTTVASQRPLVFQGPIGQAIGLFQSYQFNLMQQMFRYVADGTAKDAAMLLGLQGTFYGMAGLPAFQAINQHVIGTMSNNPKHIDAYDALVGTVGKNAGDLLMYGLPSNLLQTNLYSRGDINPRQVTVIPTALSDVPTVGAVAKFYGAVKDTFDKTAAGANVWESFLQGIEHAGISRPLSGLAQTLQATTGNGTPYSTTTKGTIMFSNDFMSLATLSRLSGGRPLDEAIINDGVYRIQAYKQYDLSRMNTLAEAVKASNIEGQITSQDQWAGFANDYAKIGGKQTQFNQFMMREIKSANTSASDLIVKQLQNPFAQKMQGIMGGSTPSTSDLQ
jgi:hypothetical protein